MKFSNTLIGRMFLMSITQNISIPRAVFEEEWLLHGLNKRFIPKQRVPSEAFRRATPKRQWKNGLMLIEYKGGKHLEEGATNEVVMVYSHDSTAKVNIHHVNRAILYLKDGEVRAEILDILTDEEIAFIETIKQDYEKALHNIDGSQCRNAIQKVMEQCATLTYRDGSYLIPRQHFDSADAIVGMIHFMNRYSEKRNILWDIPYIDTPETREQTRQALVEHIERTAEMLIAEAREWKPSPRNIVKTRKSTLRARLSDVSMVISAYERVLDMAMPEERALLNNALCELNNV